MPACHCGTDYDAIFDGTMAQRDLERYRRRGPEGSTRRLIGELVRQGVEGRSLLDIGGGVGVIGHELLSAGASHALDVDASRAYLAAAQAEAQRRGTDARAEYRYGDFVELAGETAEADIVTLDRVLCCYANSEALVDCSTARARQLYGVVYPVDRWWVRLGARAGNTVLALFRQSFRFYVHPNRTVEERIASHGLRMVHRHSGPIWRTLVYRRDNM